jgi:hypothetical protein
MQNLKFQLDFFKLKKIQMNGQEKKFQENTFEILLFYNTKKN